MAMQLQRQLQLQRQQLPMTKTMLDQACHRWCLVYRRADDRVASSR